MNFAVIVWLTLCLIFFGLPSLYFLYLRRVASKPWNVKIDREYNPPITILIPMHNEEKTIGFKLENLLQVDYPKEKMHIMLVDDASTDKTIEETTKFLNLHSELSVEVLRGTERRGKSAALNNALKLAENDVVVMSDADSFWAANVLKETLPYLADPTVGAVIGRQKVLNTSQSWITQIEEAYLNFTFEVIRLGESKIHSTIIFHGLFGAYKRQILREFNQETDDSGTALDIVQRGARTIFVPEADCFDINPVTWKNHVSTKLRRASQLVQIQARCLKLLVKNQLHLPKRIAVPEIFLYLINPIVFLLFAATTFYMLLNFQQYSIVLTLLFLGVLILPTSRRFLVVMIQNNLILLIALLSLVLRRRFLIWNTLDESRSLLTRDMLKSKNLL